MNIGKTVFNFAAKAASRNQPKQSQVHVMEDELLNKTLLLDEKIELLEHLDFLELDKIQVDNGELNIDFNFKIDVPDYLD